MKRNKFLFVSISLFSLLIAFNNFCQGDREEIRMISQESATIKLPPPAHTGTISIEEALYKRRSIRDYKAESLTIHDISQILWSAQGITDEAYGLRTAPSAGALYPLELYIAVSNVTDLSPGLYKYFPGAHSIKKMIEGNRRQDISQAAPGQEAIENSAAIVIITAVDKRTAVKYGDRAERYVHIEVGHAAQNIYLQAVSLNLGTVIIGAFYDERLRRALNLPENEHPAAIMPLGRL